MEQAASNDHFDVAVIGTGSGNSIPGGPLAGRRIAVVEEGTFGGTCINVGCIPTKMFVYTAEIAEDHARGVPPRHRRARRQRPLARHPRPYLRPHRRDRRGRQAVPAVGRRRRHFFQGHGEFAVAQPDDGTYRLTITSGVQAGTSFTADHVVLASGSRAIVPPQATESGVPFHTSDTVMRVDEVPKAADDHRRGLHRR